jgi:hypothetical protein
MNKLLATILAMLSWTPLAHASLIDNPTNRKSLALLGLLVLFMLLKYLFDRFTGEHKRLASSKKAIKKFKAGDYSREGSGVKHRQNPRVSFIVEQLEKGSTDILQSADYTYDEKALANLHLKEKGLLAIVKNMSKASTEAELNSAFQAHYFELNRSEKKELLPLVFSGDMKTKNSPYISNTTNRRIVEKAYRKLLKDDGLDIQKLKYQYLEETPMSERLPVGTPDQHPHTS